MNLRTIIFSARSLRALGGLIGGLMLFSQPAMAETLSGRVRDANNSSYLFGAEVTVAGTNNTTTTDREGRYLLRDLAPGSYQVEVSYLGYNSVSQTVTIAEGVNQVADFEAGQEVLRLEDFVVEGNREGLARALQQKRVSVNLIDVVSSDSIGKLPDDNAAEAVRRLPGVVAEIDQGEGRFIVVRGVDSALNNMTINGQTVGSPDGGSRAVAMDTVPSDLISRIEVIKAVTPDMDHNAIGASVNIVTPSAFDREEAFATVRLSGGQNEKSGQALYNGSASFGTTFGDNKWGLVMGASYSHRRYASDLYSSGGWVVRNNFYTPTSQTLFDYDVNRRRTGLNGALEFRPEEGKSFYLRSSLNTFRDDEGRNQADFDFDRGSLLNQTATSGEWTQGRASREYRSYLQTREINNLQAGMDLELGDATFDASLTVGRAERITPRRIDWEFRSSSSAFPSVYDVSGYQPVITPSDNFYEADAYPFRRVRRRSDAEVEKLMSADMNYQRDTSFFGVKGFWKTGVRWLSREKSLDRNNENYTGATNFRLSEPGLAGISPADFFDGEITFGPTLNIAALESFFASSPEYFEYDASGSQANSTESDFDASEDIWATYLMGSAEFGNLNVLTGVRLEVTEATYAGNEYGEENGAAIFRRLTGSTSYTDVLPGLHAVYKFSDRLQLRGAWTNTLGRPAYEDLAPTRETEIDEIAPGEFVGDFSEGNPNLQPYEAMNFDLSLEFYFKSAGSISAAVFHKQIDNPIYGRSTIERNVTFENRFYSTLNRSRPTNGESGEISGLELNYQQYLTFLPSPFDGFGYSMNYTWTDSKVSVPSRPGEELPFFKQADGSGNAAIYYEKYGWDVRMAVNYSGRYIAGIGGDADQDFYVDARTTWDFKAGYRINQNWSIFAEVLNLGEEPLDESRGTNARFAGREIYSWNARAGISWRM